MKHLILFSLFLLNSAFASALTLNCEGWSKKAGQDLKREKMIFSGKDPVFNSEIYSVAFEGAQYEIKWDKGLDTAYATIAFINSNSKIFATMRVPDLKVHNDLFLDFTDNNGDRVSISCDVTE